MTNPIKLLAAYVIGPLVLIGFALAVCFVSAIRKIRGESQPYDVEDL